jgi:hypothetical protein
MPFIPRFDASTELSEISGAAHSEDLPSLFLIGQNSYSA